MDSERLPLWVIYDRPKDHPTGTIARMWYSLPKPEPTERVIDARLDEIRETLASYGLACIGRSPEDDPCIVETWV